MSPQEKTLMDISALGVTAGALTEFLPAAASFISIVWMSLRIYETETVQKLFRKEGNNEQEETD